MGRQISVLMSRMLIRAIFFCHCNGDLDSYVSDSNYNCDVVHQKAMCVLDLSCCYLNDS